MPGPNQIDRLRDDVQVGEATLLAVPRGAITERGLRHNIDVGIQYMAAWLSGNGCVPIYHLMEDAATAEISRSQLWQWVHHDNAVLDDGRAVTPVLVKALFEEEVEKLRARLGDHAFRVGRFDVAHALIEDIALKPEFTEFMTLAGYDHLD
jgi:malate synthase